MKFRKKDEIMREIYSLNVSGYSDAIDRPDEIIANVIAGAPTLAELNIQTGAKAKTTVELNILSTTAMWQGGDCPTDFSGTTVLAPRSATIARLSDRESLCLDKLDAKLPKIQAAGARNEDLPFASLYIDLKVKENAKALEKAVWQGTITGGTGNNAFFDGYLQIAKDESGDLAHYDTFTSFTVSNAVAIIDAALAERSEVMHESDELVIYMDLPKFSILANALVEDYGIGGTGQYVNNGVENQLGQNAFLYKNTNIVVKGTHGLNGDGSIFITPKSNLRGLTDLESDKESVELFYDKYHKALVSDLVFAFAVQYENPGNVILLEYTGV